MRFSRFLSRLLTLTHLSDKAKKLLRKRKTRRISTFEVLEVRQMFAAAIWHNVLQPLNVSGEIGGSVDPLDVLTIVNEINNPRFSDPASGSLPPELPANTPNPYFDIDCDSRVTPLDVLNVINAINLGNYAPDWVLSGSSTSGSSSGRVVTSGCSPKLIEGDSLFTNLSQTITIPDSSSAIRVSFETPTFDKLSQNAIQDAFEILLLDQSGQPLAFPYGVDRDASYNWSENSAPVAGVGSQEVQSPPGSISTATFNVAGLAPGTKVQVITRLVNNDDDTNTGVVLKRIEIIDSQTPSPLGMPIPSSNRPTRAPVDPRLLQDVTSSVQLVFGRTTLVDDNSTLVTDVQVKNNNSTAISGRIILVVDNMSDEQLNLYSPDGFIDVAKPYFILDAKSSYAWLATGQTSASHELRFRNPNKQQFQYQFKVLAEVNSAPSGFTSSPLTEIQAGHTYEATIKAIDPDGQKLTYTKVVGPSAMSIDGETGVIHWQPAIADIGNQFVIIRATDPFGLSVDQTFTISVLENVQNRPPIFTSIPTTDAAIARPFEVLTYQTGSSPIAAAAGDFGTGKISIIAANPGDQQLGLLSGSGTEKFGISQAVSIGEINPSKFSTPFVTGASVNLGLAPNTYTNNERNVLSVINGDINGDGYLDFATAIDNDGSDFGPNDIGSVAVRLGNGDGTFREGWQAQLPAAVVGGSGVSSRADSIRFGDVNGDGRPDLVVVQSLGNKALVYTGNGDGNFANTPIESAVDETYSYSFSSQLGDMNNDGKLDLVSYESQRDGRYRAGTTVRLGDGTGKFSAGTFYANPNNNSGDGYLADVNGDGKLDTVRLNYIDSRIETRINDGTGLLSDFKFSAAFFVVGDTRGPNANPTSGYLADYNRDGKNDIVISTATTNFILLTGNGDGTFGDATQFGNRLIPVHTGVYYNSPLQIFPGAGRNDGKAPDLNTDGIPDFVFGNQQVDQLTTAINDGTGKFTTRVYQSGFSDDIGNGSVRGSNPTSHVSVGDFNNDGVSDVLLGRDQSNGSNVRVGGVGIALGANEPGSLRLPQVLFAGTEDIVVGNGSQVLADFDNDGILDIASNIRAGVAVAKGRADGSFETYTTGFNQFGVFSTESLVSSDFDRDGNMDIAYFASMNNPGYSPSMTTLFGLGNGTFQRAAAPVPTGLFGPGTISQQYGVAADVNGDGYPDLVYRFPNNHSNFATAKTLVVYLYDPSTRNMTLVTDRDNLLFTPHRGGFYQDEVVAFEDLNGDGKKELIVHSGAQGQNGIIDIPERLTIWQPTNNATATDASDLFNRIEFQNPGISPGLGVEGSINSLLVADYNRDGKPDLAVSSQNGTSTVLFGNGDFTFRSPVTYSTNQITGLKTADVNGDGNLDLIPIWSGFFNYNDLNNTGVLLGRADGSFGTYQGLTTSGYELNSPIVGDFNQDGRDDINYGNYYGTRLTVLAASSGLSSVSTGDLNGDGKLDVVALDTGFARLKILLGNGDDTFTRQKDLFTGLQPESLVLQDINLDGKLDILTTNRVSKSISLFTNDGAGSFTRSDLNLTSQPDGMAVGDLNGDSKPDIVAVSGKSQSLSVLLNTASGFASATEQPIGFAAEDVVFADLTLDGKMDVILSDPSGKRIMTLPGQGNGSFGVPIVQPLQQTPDKIVATDLNADGKPDIVATFPSQNQVGVLFGRGGGRFTSPQIIGVGEQPSSISVEDINGDGKPDLLVANQGDDTLSVIINRYDPASVYRYALAATDPDADPVSFELLNAPGGALYDEATKSIVWAPMPDQIGANLMVVRASDGRGGYAEQGFSITVTAPVETVSPSFTSEPIVELSGDQAYVYQTRISNPSNGPVRFSLVDAPEGASIDPITGVVNWDPRENGLSLGVRGSFNFPNNIENRGSISIPASPSINTTTFTAEGWYKFDSLDNTTLFRKYHSSFYNSWSLSNFFGTLRAEINNFGGTPDVRLDTIRLTTNKWYHIAFAYDDATRLAQLFVNGELVESVISTGSPQLSDGALNVDGLEGTVANMRLWNRGLTSQEVRNSMSQQIPSNSTGLVIDYHFAEGPSSVSIVDSSPYGNNGDLFIVGDFSRYNFPTRIPSIAAAITSPFTIRVEDGKGGSATQSFSVTTLPPLPKSIQGTVFDDVNGNGIKDGDNEPVLVDQVVYIDQNGNRQLDLNESRASTDASGNYTLLHVGTKANLALASVPGRIQTSPTTPWQLVDLGSGNATSVFFGSKSTIDSKPIFISAPPTIASVPGELLYQAFALSTDGSPILYEIAVAPLQASIDKLGGLFKWTPKLSDAGSVDVILKATDGAGRVALQAFRLTVEINTAPTITSTAPSTASQGVLFHYDVRAQDAEQSSLTYNLEHAPAGATIDNAFGKIRWVPSSSQLGIHSFLVVVNDGKDLQAKQSFHVDVALPVANRLPLFVTGPRSYAQVGVTYHSTVHATDADDDLLTYSLISGPSDATISGDGFISWVSPEIGSHSMRIRVVDNRGGMDDRTFTVDVGSTPAKGSIQFTSKPVLNAVTEREYSYDSFAFGARQYQLLTAPTGMSIDPIFGRIRWTPAVEQLGLTTIQIQAIDELGNTANQSYSISVQRSDSLSTVTSVPKTQTTVGSTYVYIVQTENSTGNPLVYSLSVAPQGMSIDSQTGVINWTPTASQVGIQSVLLRVTDGAGNFLTQSFSVLVLAGSPNRQPIATSIPFQDATVDSSIAYRFIAADPEGDSLTYSVVAGPDGLSIDSTTGTLNWIPNTNQIGTTSIILKASDSFGAAAIQSFVVDVRGANRAPSIGSTAPLAVAQGGLYRYDLIATDPDRELLFYELTAAPQGMGIDSFGRIRWQTALDTTVGPRSVSVRVFDGRGGSDVQNFTLNVVADTTAPKVTILTSSMVLSPWNVGPSVVKVQAVDDVDVASLQLFVDGKAVAIRTDGTADVFFTAPGNGKLLAYAFDPAGNRGSATNRILMCSGEEECIPDGSTNQPQTILSNVQDGDSVTGFVELMGTAASADFDSYELSYRRSDQTAYTMISSSTESVSSGLLGTWDTTLLENDSYVLRLEARDKFGGYSAIERSVGVSGNLKLGNFRLSFTDLTIPVAGIPITLTRTYDTLRSDRNGDFGYGWRMEFRNTDLRTSLPKTGLEAQGIYSAFKPNTKVYITLPGGQREGFTFTPDIRVLPGFGGNLVIATPKFTSDRGVKNTLSAGSGNLLVNERGELYASGGIPWNPASPDFSGYTLTTPDGIQYKIDGTGNLYETMDRNRNTLSFSEAGVSSSSGVSITFDRDNKGRIASVTDPAGNSVKYVYDTKGDLVSVTDRMGNVTKFLYRSDRPHYLDSVIDPQGRTGLKSIYGEDGRLIGTLGATGHGPTVSYDPDNSLVTTTDALGNNTISEYDSRGNVVTVTDSLGGTMRMTYDNANNMTSSIDTLGHMTSYSYDGLSRETMRTLADGSTTRWTYDTFGGLLSVTNSLGETTRSTFDDRGNKLTETTPSGANTTFAYDHRGLLTTTIDAAGYITTQDYDAKGRRTRLTQADNSVVTFSQDALGQDNLAEIWVTTTNGRVLARVTTQRDANGQIVAVTDAAGNVTSYVNNEAGQPTAVTTPLGTATAEYDATGNLIRMISADGLKTEQTFDAMGRATTSSFAGLVSSTTYDALGRSTGSVGPGGTSLSVAYNAGSQPISVQTKTGTPTRYEFDDVGRPIFASDESGERSVTYDAAGRVVLQTDASGTTRFAYDADGNVIRITDPSGEVISTERDARGLPISVRTALGYETRFEYDGLRRVVAVIDSTGGRTSYGYDELNRLTTQTDVLGRVTRYEYDLLGRRTAVIRPDGSREASTYDAAGRLSRTVNAEGQIVDRTYDVLGRLSTRTTALGQVTYERNAIGLPTAVSDGRGTATLEYDSSFRLIRRTEANGRFVAYTYNSEGRMATIGTPSGPVTYEYDADGRTTRVQDAAGGITSLSYDEQGRVNRRDYPNGLSERTTYDSQGRRTRLTLIRDSVTLDDIDYAYDVQGRLSSMDRAGVGRTTYSYDDQDRLIQERLTPTTGAVHTTTYTYDAVGNRLSRNTPEGLETYSYDVSDRLLAVHGVNARTFTYDQQGRVIRVNYSEEKYTTYEWDADDRLTEARRTTANGTIVVAYLYDAAGNLAQRTENGEVSNYLIDANRPLAEIIEVTGNAGTTRYTVDATGRLAATGSGGTQYYHADRQNTLLNTSDAAGQVTKLPTVDAFGVTNTAVPGMVYAGLERDLATGLDNARARQYDSTTGRFLTRDAFSGTTTSPLSQHDYLYAAGSPSNNTDPTGYFTLSDLQTSGYIQNLLLASVVQAAIGAGLSAVTGKTVWSGPTAQLTVGTDVFGGMLLKSAPNATKTSTTAAVLSIGEGLKLTEVLDGLRDSVANTALTSSTPFSAGILTSLGFDFLIGTGGSGHTFGNADMKAPALFGSGGFGPLLSFSGGYLSAGVGVQAGPLVGLAALPYGMLTYLLEGEFRGANGFGVSITLSGFSLGATWNDVTLTSSGGVGASLVIGVAIGLPIPGYVNVPANG